MDRYKQIQPKFVFAETEIVYAGKTIDVIPKVAQVAKELLSVGLQNIILLPSTKTGKEPSTAYVPRRCVLFTFKTYRSLSYFIEAFPCRRSSPAVMGVHSPSNSYLSATRCISYTPPVRVVHPSALFIRPESVPFALSNYLGSLTSFKGILLNGLKDCSLVYSMTSDDTYFQYTTVRGMALCFSLTSKDV